MIHHIILVIAIALSLISNHTKTADPAEYLNDLKAELIKEWPHNKTINIVFHGHSVPAGYFRTPIVNTLESYPYQVLKRLKSIYPYAVINIINTSIGGENSAKGENRFEHTVLNHNPDVIFIDYALNDRAIGLETAKKSWESMIEKALQRKIKVILMTPSPDQRVNLLEKDNELEKHTNQISSLANTYEIGLVDSYELFRQKVLSGDSITTYMSQSNHPNRSGHTIITEGIIRYFE